VREGFGCRERVREVIEGVRGWLYHRLLAGRRQERIWLTILDPGTGGRWGVGGSSRM
jgi:hypothetical protein